MHSRMVENPGDVERSNDARSKFLGPDLKGNDPGGQTRCQIQVTIHFAFNPEGKSCLLPGALTLANEGSGSGNTNLRLLGRKPGVLVAYVTPKGL